MKDPRGENLNLPQMAAAGLAKLLEDRRPFVRDRAVELLVEAGDAAIDPLAAVRRASRDFESRAAAVFALYRIGTPKAAEAVRAALNDADFRVRTAAARCAGMEGDREAVARLLQIVKTAANPARIRRLVESAARKTCV